jgi:phage/plasmid-like protein (TIGR03299 family)
MAHNVYEIGDGHSMGYVGDKPWHGLGQEVDADAPLEVWAKEAHLDWTVDMADVQFTPNGFDATTIMDTRKVIYRTDTGMPLSVVSHLYKPVQPTEVLEFFRDLIDSHGFRMNTAGSVRDGKRVWALAEIGKEMTIMGQDKVKGFLLLGTSYDTSLATTAMFTSVRVVCDNTLQWAYNADSKGDGAVKVPHFSVFDAEQVQFDLGIVGKSWERFEEQAQEMARRKVTEQEAVKFFMNILHKDSNEDDYSDVSSKQLTKLMLINSSAVGQNLRSADGTAWGLVNAVTRYVDHEKGERIEGNRLDQAWFGFGAKLKEKAWAMADDMISIAA